MTWTWSTFGLSFLSFLLHLFPLAFLALDFYLVCNTTDCDLIFSQCCLAVWKLGLVVVYFSRRSHHKNFSYPALILSIIPHSAKASLDPMKLWMTQGSWASELGSHDNCPATLQGLKLLKSARSRFCLYIISGQWYNIWTSYMFDSLLRVLVFSSSFSEKALKFTSLHNVGKYHDDFSAVKMWNHGWVSAIFVFYMRDIKKKRHALQWIRSSPKRLGGKVENSFDPTVKNPTHNIIFDAILNVEVCLEILLFDESHVHKHQCYRKSVEERLFAFLANLTKTTNFRVRWGSKVRKIKNSFLKNEA